MSDFPNIHANLINTELHVPKDFSVALNGTVLTKNTIGELTWEKKCWECPIIDFVDAAQPPPSSADGDRYIIYTTASTIDAGWGGAAANDLVQYDVDTTAYVNLTPEEGLTLYDKSRDGYWSFDGTNWEGRDFKFENTITSAEILALNGSPKTIITAPLVGYAIVLTEVEFKFKYNGVAYLTNFAINLQSVGADTFFMGSNIIRSVKDVYTTAGVQTVGWDNTQILEATAIEAFAPANPTTGNSDLIVRGRYKIIKI